MKYSLNKTKSNYLNYCYDFFQSYAEENIMEPVNVVNNLK